MTTVDDAARFLDPASMDDRAFPLSTGEAAALDRINLKVAAAESLDRVMDFVFDSTSGLFPCDRIGLAFLEEGGRRSVARWGRARYEPVLLKTGYSEDTAGSSLLRILETGHIRIIDDLERYGRAHPRSASTKLLLREGVRSSMTCPLKVEGRVVGWLFRSSRQPGVYGDREARIHRDMAERLGQAVEKAWRIEQLASANQAYMEMLGFVSHELKSPLSSIILDAGVLADGYLGPLSAPQQDKVRRLKNKAETLLALTRKYLDLVRLEEGRMKAEIRPAVDVASELIEPAVALLEAQAKERRQTIVRDWVDGLKAACDPELMKIVFVNLIGNGIKYGTPGGTVRISMDVSAGLFTTRVWNDGVGFDPAEKSRLFRRFSRLPSSSGAAKGSGVGLYTCWQIVQLHGGRIRGDSEKGKWAEFSVELPQPG